jgi:hypothetical protein
MPTERGAFTGNPPGPVGPPVASVKAENSKETNTSTPRSGELKSEGGANESLSNAYNADAVQRKRWRAGRGGNKHPAMSALLSEGDQGSNSGAARRK